MAGPKMASKARAAAEEQIKASATTIARDKIIVDETLYPRYNESPATITAYAEQMRGGAQFPPVKINQDNKLIDGKHRLEAYDLNGIKQIPFIRERTKDDVDFFRRAMTANSHHGQRYTGIDYANMVLKGRALGISDDEIAKLVYVTPGFLQEATRDWFALNSKSQQVAIKRTIRHMRGRKLTAGQVEANKKLSGMNQSFYVNQVLLLLENDLIDTDNGPLLEKLHQLQLALGKFEISWAKQQKGAMNGN